MIGQLQSLKYTSDKTFIALFGSLTDKQDERFI